MRGKIVILFILLLTGLSECTTSVSEIGADFFTNKSTFDIAFVDTVTLKVSTVLRDSMVTSNTSRLLVGYHQDERLGTITSQSVFQLGISNVITPDKNNTEYVSLRLHLKKDGYSYYDTTQAQTLYVYQLTKGLTSLYGLYFNSSKFTIDRTAPPLGTLTFLPRPRHTSDSLEISLSDDLGRQLMTMAQTNDARLTSTANFIKFFKGLAILPDTTNSRAFLGFLSGAEMRVYYNDRTTTPTSLKFLSFPIGSNAYFSKIHSWRSSTPLHSLKKANQEVISKVTDNEGYFQCGVGLAMRVEMPHLRTLRYNDGTFVSTRAVLEFRPIKPYATNQLPQTLIMNFVNEQNNLLINTPFGIPLIKDVEYGRNTLYSADVTSFVNAQLPNILDTKNALLILVDDAALDANKVSHGYRSSVDRLYLGDQNNQYNMKLRIFYLTLPNQSN